jgi:hypothetical protein
VGIVKGIFLYKGDSARQGNTHLFLILFLLLSFFMYFLMIWCCFTLPYICRLGGKKGVRHLASPYRLKKYIC